jgi:hypothetical protein
MAIETEKMEIQAFQGKEPISPKTWIDNKY